MKLTMTLAILAVIPFVFGCHPKKAISVPDHLVGAWSTSSPRYADRSLQITKNRIIFESGKEPSGIHRIEKLQEVQRGKYRSYDLTYKDEEGQDFILFFTYDPTNNGEIRIRNQRNVTWTRNSIEAQ